MRGEIDLTSTAGKFIVRGADPYIDRVRSCRVCETCGAPATHREDEPVPITTITRNGTVFHQTAPRHRYYCATHTGTTA